MNLGKGFPFSWENGATSNGDYWIPVTPQKPVTWDPNSRPVGLQGNQTRSTNFPELLGSCSRLLPEKPVLWRSNPIQSSELLVNQTATNSSGTLFRSQRTFSSQNPVAQSSNSIHAEMQGNQKESRSWQESRGIYHPPLPEKQITRSSDPIAIGMQGNQTENTNWQDLLGVYSDLLQQTTKSDTFHNSNSTRHLGQGQPNIQSGPVVEANECFNYNAGYYLQNFSKDIPFSNGNRLVKLPDMNDAPYCLSPDYQTNRRIHLRPYSPIGNNWIEQQSASAMPLHQNQILAPNQAINNCSLQQIPRDAFPIPYQASYNLNSPPRKETLGAPGTSCFQIAPLTPDQGKQLKNHQLSALNNFSVDESQSQDIDKQEITSTDGQELGKQYNQLLQSVIASSSPSNTKSFEEKNNFEDGGKLIQEKNISEDGGYGGIDLNKTPQQKTPKRKKHRPRVVVEGKPKRTPKPTPSKTRISNETPSGKRKYVRRKGLRDSTSRQGTEKKPIEDYSVQSAVKSCRRALSFDIEDKMQERGQDKISDNQPESKNKRFDLNMTTQGLASSSTIPAAREEQQMRYCAETQSQSICSLINATNQKSAEKFLPLATIAPPTTARDHMLNVIARTINLQNATPHQPNKYGCSQVHQQIHGDTVGQMPLQTNTTCAKLERAKQLILQTRIASAKGGAKEQGGLVQVSSSPYNYSRLPYPNLELQNSSNKQTSGSNGIVDDQTVDPIAVGNNSAERRSLSLVDLKKDNIRGQCFTRYTESQSPSLLIGVTNPKRVHTPTQANGIRTPDVDKAVKRHMVTLQSSIQAFSKEKELQKHYEKEKGYLPFSRIARGKNDELEHAMQIDEITCQLKGLQINNSGQAAVREEQTALVPYKGDGTIVPYEGFDPIKKQKPRPKVDLDPETNRLWNLLMGKPGSESAETMDKDKEKWWEEERRVFRGRVDSFIARMHLVQGDRRFSRWKGSVVDSVVGVFLTQNVSDHLSSSAFMSLAAKFPLPKILNPASTWTEEPEVEIIDPDGTTAYHGRTLNQPLYKSNSTESSESSEQGSDNFIMETGINFVKENTRATEEEVFSSQNSAESLILQPNEDVQSTSESEVEDHVLMLNSNKSRSPKIVLQTERPTSRQQHLSHETQSPLLEKRPIHKCQKQPSHVCIRQNSALDIGSDVYCYPINPDVLQLQGSFASSGSFWVNKASENEVPEPYFFGLSAKHSFSPSAVEATQTIDVIHHGTNIQHAAGRCISDEQGSSKSSQLERASETEAKRFDEAGVQKQTGNIDPSIEQLGSKNTNIPNLRKRKLDDRAKSYDWDTLRKQVLSKGAKQRRDKDKMDSLDYEVLRHADVKKISDTIRERGMNNMLAERIKEFLNRLVRDHGSIDLEWLRDVPPDKAKEYLLSIRGLGLKSVECVRLLTLHHMAFPVDTNVGRIAVRLGWVPLQPLPESLQLHLLELYPVQESIQKYLWPRLCKLDQRTLYELHYQLITFGKVFCTKSKPNCNACPMRPECRHFASAFASARLALPGPEERNIVNSAIPIEVNGGPAPVMKHMLLHPPETNMVRESEYISSQWQPIIEEPTTPAPSTEESEVDIEDLLSEDTEEIPTIDLSFEQLKMNVQSIIQERKMEIPEGDLSRALVVLNPEDASIPVPKLKNVNRLRTEHQVYVIPDSHPLLNKMERREPDDPSPYLLAIWTPGETANSTQPPENKCNYQGTGRLCNEETCFSCNSIREANSQIVRGTLLIPCRTAMRGNFPLNGTYFQVNEVFADQESSIKPIEVPRDWLWSLQRRTVYFGTSVSSIFRGLTTVGIQYCFWKGFVCVRGFDRQTRAPRPLVVRLHNPASKKAKNKNENKNK